MHEGTLDSFAESSNYVPVPWWIHCGFSKINPSSCGGNGVDAFALLGAADN
jgi:hypothetical protein